MVTLTCPNPEDLRSFHLGILDERRELEVLDHLNACQTCEDTVANLEGTADSLIAAVRTSAAADSSVSEDRPALQQALAEIEGLIDQPVSRDAKQESEASPVTERIRDYELLGTLGEGGMGTVYRARHTRLGRQVALKLLPARRLRDNAAVARFEREMKAIGRLDHPTIVRATDAGDVDGTHFLAMDYVEGIDLSKLVRLVGPLDVASACEIVRQAAIGLDYAHQQNLIHRDVKPSNLMLTLRGEVRILDLGLALFGAASEALDELTTVGQLMGTLDYMAPEQGDNSHDVDARADVYSLGATLFKLLTGSAPYDSPGTRTPLAKMKALATIDAPSVAERRSELPAELVAVVDRALLRNVDDRFLSAKDLADSLQPFCQGHVLSDLAECGQNLATQAEKEIVLPPSLPPFVSREDVSPPRETPEAQLRVANNEGGLGRKLARWTLIPLTLLAGIMIWLQTDNGTLLIEADESVPIEIRRTGKPAQRETLKVGQNSLTISSGDYEIVLPKEYDSLKVENGKFELSRGGTWIARVTKQPDTPVLASSSTQPEKTSASVSVLPSPVPSSNDTFAPPLPSNDPFAPAFPAERFELETTVWEIDQKAIREGVTGPPLLSPRSALELLDPIVLGDFKYPHEEFRDQPLPPFVLYRTGENVAQVLTAPPLIKCVRKVRTTPTKSEHDPEPEAGRGAYTDADAGFMTSDGSRYNRRLAPSLNAAGQMTLTLEFERALRIGEPGAEGRTRRKTFAVDPLREDETLVVLEVDPEADKVWLWEIKPGQNGRKLLARSVSATLPAVALKAADVPFGLRTTVWRINQKVLRSGAIQPVTIQPLSAAGLLNRLVSYKFSGPQHPYPAFAMARTRTDVGTFLKQPGLDRCCQQANIWNSRHDFTQQVGPLSGPLNRYEGRASATDRRTINLTLTPELKESGEIALELLVKRQPGDEAGASPTAGDVRVGTPATQSFRIETLALHETLIVTELDPLADEFLLFEIEPVPRTEIPEFPTLDNPFLEPTATTSPANVPEPVSPAYVPQGIGPQAKPVPATAANSLIKFDTGVWELDEAKLSSLKPTLAKQASSVDEFLHELGLRYISPKELAKNPSVGMSNDDVLPSLRRLVDAGAVKVLAEPSIVTQSGRRASLVSGGEFPVLKPEPDNTARIDFRELGLRLDLEPRLAKSQLWIDLAFSLSERGSLAPPAEPTQAKPAPNTAPTTPVKRDVYEVTLAMHWGESLLLIDRNYKPGRVLLLTIKPELVNVETPQAVPSLSPPSTDLPAPSALPVIPPGNRVVPVRIDPSRSIPGMLKAGDLVDLLAVGPQQTGPGLKVWTLAESLEVFSHRANPPNRAEPRAVLVLATAEQAREITLAEEVGHIHVVLRSHNTDSPQPGTSPRRPVPKDMRVVNVTTELTGVGDSLLSPGEHVDLLATLVVRNGNGAKRQVKPVAESLEVFAVGAFEAPLLKQRVVSLVVTPEQARVIKLAEEVGRIHIVLRAKDAERTMTPDDLTDLINLLSGVTEPSEPPEPEPVYSGKTLDDWQTVVLTERNPANLVEAVQALTILGKGGRDAEAGTAILSCLAPFSPDSRLRKTPEGQLVDTIQDRFWQLDRAALTPVLVETIQLGNSNQREFILVLNKSRLEKLFEPGGSLLTPQMVHVLVEATNDADPDVRRAATAFLTPLLLGNAVSLPDAELASVTSRLKELLGDEQANLAAAVCLSQLAPETEGLSKILLSGVKEFMANETDRTLQLTDSYWALRKLVVHDQSMQEQLTQPLLELLRKPRHKPPAHVYQIDYYNFDHQSLVAELLVAGERRSDATTHTIRGVLVDLYGTAARSNRARNPAGGDFGGTQKPAPPEDPMKPDAALYTPVLTDDYSFLLPPELRRQKAPGEFQADAEVTAAAAAWALKQLELARDSKPVDE